MCTLVAGVIAPVTGASSALADEQGDRPVTGIGIRLVDVPTTTADDPRARTYIIDHLAPGSVIERRVEVTNGTRSEATVSVYPAAASIKGGDFIGAAGDSKNALSTWTSTAPGSLVLTPREKAFVKVTVDVPPNAAPGESYGVVWAEVTTPSSTAGGITQVSRVGIRLYLSVGPGGAPASDFEIVSLTGSRDEAGTPLVQASIRNTGGRALDLSGTLDLSEGPGGLSAGPFPITLGTTLGVGQTEPVTVSLDEQVPDGPWLANMQVKSGLNTRTAEATLSFPTAPGVGATVSTSTVPWWLIAAGILAVLLLLIMLVWFLRRRRREHSEDLTPQPVPVGT